MWVNKFANVMEDCHPSDSSREIKAKRKLFRIVQTNYAKMLGLKDVLRRLHPMEKPFFVCLFFFFFFPLFKAALISYGGSRAKGWINT